MRARTVSRSTALLPTSAVLTLLVVLTGCGGAEEQGTTGVAYCHPSVGGADPADRVEVVMRQGDEVVGEGTAQVGTALGFQVPLNRRTDVYVDGELRGSAGEDHVDPDGGAEVPGGWVYLSGEGCPAEPPGG